MEPDSLKQCIFLVILLFLSGFFSMSETSLTSINKIRLRSMVEEKVKGALAIEKLLKNPKKLLTTILIGNNIVNLAASAIATTLAISLSGGDNKLIGASTGILTFLILVFGEITPKTIASQNAEKIALFVTPFLTILVVIFTPLVFVLNNITGFFIKILGGDPNQNSPLITELELKTMVNVSHEEGVLQAEEKAMINNVFEFGDIVARDVMTPRTDIIAVEFGANIVEIVDIFKDERYSRIPVYKESLDKIVGILNLKDIIFHNKDEEFSLEKIMRETHYTYETKPVQELFHIMKTESISIAVVLDEYGGTSGIVTIEDLIEEIVGDISDEYDDEEEEITVLEENIYMMDGSVKIDDVNEKLGILIESEDFDSIGGYVVGLTGNIPEVGIEVEAENLRFSIEKVNKNRIELLKIQVLKRD